MTAIHVSPCCICCFCICSSHQLQEALSNSELNSQVKMPSHSCTESACRNDAVFPDISVFVASKMYTYLLTISCLRVWFSSSTSFIRASCLCKLCIMLTNTLCKYFKENIFKTWHKERIFMQTRTILTKTINMFSILKFHNNAKRCFALY